MPSSPGPFLFEAEHHAGSWPARYLPSEQVRAEGPRPLSGGLRALWALLRCGDSWAVEGVMHLTNRRLIFEARALQGHPLGGQFSLFLPRLTTLNGQASVWQDFLHNGCKDPSRWQLRFHLRYPGAFNGSLLAQQSKNLARQDATADEAFQAALQARWWLAGLGLREDRDSPPPEAGYRIALPVFDELLAHRPGLAGLGLRHLRWLLDPDEPEPPLEPVGVVPAGVVPFDESALTGRPLFVGASARQSLLRRGSPW